MIDFDLIRVTDVRYVRDHVLWLRFSDGCEGEVDFSGALTGPVFEPLRDPAYFAQVRLWEPTVAWPNGADIAPDTLHEWLRAAQGYVGESNDDVFGPSAATLAAMPEISRFLGIVIQMYFTDHLSPHFHARYAEFSVKVEIADDEVFGDPRFPRRRLKRILEWRALHEEELMANWERLRDGLAPLPIAGLE